MKNKKVIRLFTAMLAASVPEKNELMPRAAIMPELSVPRANWTLLAGLVVTSSLPS